MNCISLNVRGIRGSAKKTWVQSLKKENNVSIVLLQESMVEVVEHKDIVGFWGRSELEFDFVPSVGNSGGLIAIWDPMIFSFGQCVKDRNYLLISGRLRGVQDDVMIMNIYAPQD